MCCTWLAENTGRKNYAKNRHLRTIAQICRAISSQLRHVSTIGKKLIKQHLLHMSSQQQLRLVRELGGTPANLNEFRVLASLLHRRCATEVNQTLVYTMFGRLLGWYIIHCESKTRHYNIVHNFAKC